MAYPGSQFGYQPPPTDPRLDGTPATFIDEEESSLLDHTILDGDVMQSPTAIAAPFRKHSYPNGPGVLSPAESHGWEPHYPPGVPVDAVNGAASNPFHDDPRFFGRPVNLPPSAYHQPRHPATWSYERGSGDRTPTPGTGFAPPGPRFDGPQYAHHGADALPPGFPHPHHVPHHGRPPAPPPPPFGGHHPDAGFIPPPQVQTPMSPHSHQDWMGMAQQEMESKRRPGSPVRTLVDLQRRDGIRKKNGRIDIPQERNIHTIEQLIEKTTDEELLKELKQQKRLLRNREAALASRQRKKKHTEDLEYKEKGYTQQIAILEGKISDLTIERDHRERERQAMHQRLQESQRIIDAMHDEQRDLVLKHTDETSQLRKKIQVLTDQLEAGPAPIMSAAPSSTGFTDFNAEMEALHMEPHDWDSLIFTHDLRNDPDDVTLDLVSDRNRRPSALDYPIRVDPGSSTPPLRSGDALVDQASASGLLFMLLLCGAFVAAKPASSSLTEIPPMPADVRAAAPRILDNLLSESSLATAQARGPRIADVAPEPVRAGPHLGTPGKASRLDRLHRSLTAPTRQQEIEQAFSLTPAQYASITNVDLPVRNSASAASAGPQPRRNLAEALADMEREHKRNSKAEVYTRSLLWDQIPADVVKQFKEMVRDHAELEARQPQDPNYQHDDLGFKMEP